MKQTLIPILFLILCSVNLTAQDTIVLDGKKIPKKELNHFNGEGYKIDLTKPEYASSLKNPVIEKDKRITGQQVFASKGMKSFLQTTNFERTDSADYYLPSSKLTFFDENGKIKWEKKLDKKVPMYCYLSPDGKYSIFDIHNLSLDTSDRNSLFIFDEKGDTICEYSSPVKYWISKSREIVCYQGDVNPTGKPGDKKIFYCIDLKTAKHWSKNFEKDVSIEPASYNGNYLLAYSDSTYELFYHDGKELFKKNIKEFGGRISEISNDGNFSLSIRNGSETHFDIYNIKTMERIRTKYYKVENVEIKTKQLYNGGCFVNNCSNLVTLTSIIAPYTAMIVFHNLQGEYIGHKVYNNIKSSFWSPIITLLDDGSFEVYMDGYYLGNLTLPGVNTKQYLSKTVE